MFTLCTPPNSFHNARSGTVRPRLEHKRPNPPKLTALKKVLVHRMQAKWDADNSGEVTDEEAYVAEMALLTRQKAVRAPLEPPSNPPSRLLSPAPRGVP
jgi:hypothetical protein